MGRNSIVRLGLEKEALRLREARSSHVDAVAALNKILDKRGINESRITRSSYTRWLATLDKTTLAAIHEPRLAAENAALTVDIGGRVRDALKKLDELADEADAESRAPLCPGCGSELCCPDVCGATVEPSGRNWRATLGVLKEARQQAALYADLLERVYDAEQIKRFQAEVMAAVEEADPQTAQRIRVALRARHEFRRAALLGA